MNRGQSICIQNATGRMRALRLEPWARHFLLTPDEIVEVIVPSGPEGPGIRVVEAADATLLYTQGCDRIRVIQDGITHELLPVDTAAAAPPRDDDPMWDRDLDGVT